ncbi:MULTISPECIES: hypothetical protein [Brevibacillus]|uniref:hypothetical protein n=1 Tax=Brevibacillus TaxID=55080 RepID=UPI000271C3C0|nr:MULTISPECIES: hypothetical protein [Brevibacillus]EJL46890.1 hypothetical protein PMI08_00906 [Brevibacillus sp. CF112]MED1822654.1 hypothetical protein [Brevibacillus agri]
MDRQQLICETLESISEYLPKLSAASAKIATDIQSHQSNWLETLIAYLEGVAWLTLAIEGISKLDPEILASWNLGELNRLLDELKNGLEQEDFVSVCDLLQYELQPLLVSFEDNLLRVRK